MLRYYFEYFLLILNSLETFVWQDFDKYYEDEILNGFAYNTIQFVNRGKKFQRIVLKLNEHPEFCPYSHLQGIYSFGGK